MNLLGVNVGCLKVELKPSGLQLKFKFEIQYFLFCVCDSYRHVYFFSELHLSTKK